MTTDAGADAGRVEVLRRRRKRLDAVGVLAGVIGGIAAQIAFGPVTDWPLIVMGICILVIAVALVIRSRLTRAIWALDPPAELLWKRSWPDGT